MRNVQPGSGADLDDPPVGVAQQGATPAAQPAISPSQRKGLYTRAKIRIHTSDGGVA